MNKIYWISCIILCACSSSQKQTKLSAEAPSSCINELIKQFATEEKTNPPRSVYQYIYYADTVYFVPAPCCDFFSDLYDKNCTLIAHPGGGFTGKGDGRAKDFFNKRTNEQLIWKDERE